jgi:hypothetical protein
MKTYMERLERSEIDPDDRVIDMTCDDVVVRWLQKNHPEVRPSAVSANDIKAAYAENEKNDRQAKLICDLLDIGYPSAVSLRVFMARVGG